MGRFSIAVPYGGSWPTVVKQTKATVEVKVVDFAVFLGRDNRAVGAMADASLQAILMR